MEAAGGVGEQLPGDDEDGPGDRDERFELADASGQATVAGTEEGVGPRAEAAASPSALLRVGLPLPVRPDRLFVPDWMARGVSLAQDTRCPQVGKTARVTFTLTVTGFVPAVALKSPLNPFGSPSEIATPSPDSGLGLAGIDKVRLVRLGRP